LSRERETVSDTGPLITLEKLSAGYRFIRLLYDKIIIPPTVLDELAQGQFVSPQAYLIHYGIEDLLDVVEAPGDRMQPGSELLDVGEREAIQLALVRGLPLLIEEEAGRQYAANEAAAGTRAEALRLRLFVGLVIDGIDVRQRGLNRANVWRERTNINA
jgi:predicted nucleic acid-binding protein